MKRFSLFAAVLLLAACQSEAPDLKLNDLGYFERQGVNVLVFSNPFSGGFNDEKNSGIEIIHHGVRTVQGGAVRLNVTPEQWDLVPTMTSRVVDTLAQTIEVGMRFDWYDFDSRVVVEPKGKAVLEQGLSRGRQAQPLPALCGERHEGAAQRGESAPVQGVPDV